MLLKNHNPRRAARGGAVPDEVALMILIRRANIFYVRRYYVYFPRVGLRFPVPEKQRPLITSSDVHAIVLAIISYKEPFLYEGIDVDRQV